MHHGIKGMKWGVRRTPEQLGRKEAKALKKSYKENDKKLKDQQSRQYRSWVNATKDSAVQTRDYIMSEKRKYKSGEITKDEYKQNKSIAIAAKRNFDNQQEYNMAIAQYHVQRARSMNMQIYIGAVKGKNSKAYQRGEKHLRKNMESWGNYTVSAKPDGTYHVTRYDYYYY